MIVRNFVTDLDGFCLSLAVVLVFLYRGVLRSWVSLRVGGEGPVALFGPAWGIVRCLPAQALLSGPDNAIVIDVRTTQEFRQDGRLPEAYNISLPEMPQHSEEIREHRESAVILVCQTHKRPKIAAGHLYKVGFSDLKTLRDGMEAWHRAGFVTNKEAQIYSGLLAAVPTLMNGHFPSFG